jgi:hypothetical protein
MKSLTVALAVLGVAMPVYADTKTLTVTPPQNGSIEVRQFESTTAHNCGNNPATGGTDCMTTFGAGVAITAVAKPDPGYAFYRWTGACAGIAGTAVSIGSTCQMALSSDLTIGAYFSPLKTINVMATGKGTVKIVDPPSDTNCDAGCKPQFPYIPSAPQTVTFEATPATTDLIMEAHGCTFDQTTNRCTVTVGVNQANVSFAFRKPKFTVHFTGAGSVTAAFKTPVVASGVADMYSWLAIAGFGDCAKLATNNGAVCTCSATDPGAVTECSGEYERGASMLAFHVSPARDSTGTYATSVLGSYQSTITENCAVFWYDGNTGRDLPGTGPQCKATSAKGNTAQDQYVNVQFQSSAHLNLSFASDTGYGEIDGNGLECSSKQGGSARAKCGNDFVAGTPITLTTMGYSTGDGSYSNYAWTGACANVDPRQPCTFNINAFTTVGADFRKSVTVTVKPPANGRITGTLAMTKGVNGAPYSLSQTIDCGQMIAAPSRLVSLTQCSATGFAGAATLTLSAAPVDAFTFPGFNGDLCTGSVCSGVTVTASHTVGVVGDAFTGAQYFTGARQTNDCGTIIVQGTSGRQLICLGDCVGAFASGERVTVTGQTDDWCAFLDWTTPLGDCANGKQTCTVAMDGPKTIKGQFGVRRGGDYEHVMDVAVADRTSPCPTGMVRTQLDMNFGVLESQAQMSLCVRKGGLRKYALSGLTVHRTTRDTMARACGSGVPVAMDLPPYSNGLDPFERVWLCASYGGSFAVDDIAFDTYNAVAIPIEGGICSPSDDHRYYSVKWDVGSEFHYQDKTDYRNAADMNKYRGHMFVYLCTYQPTRSPNLGY